AKMNTMLGRSCACGTNGSKPSSSISGVNLIIITWLFLLLDSRPVIVFCFLRRCSAVHILPLPVDQSLPYTHRPYVTIHQPSAVRQAHRLWQTANRFYLRAQGSASRRGRWQ